MPWERPGDNFVGHTPSTAGTFRKKFRKNSGKTPETLSERFLEFPSRVRLGSPKPYNSRDLRLPEHFQNCLPQYGWGRLFFSESVPERASQSWSWNSQQYWGYFWFRDVPGTPGTFGPIYVEIHIQGAECPRDRRDRWQDRGQDRWDMSTGQMGHKPGGVPPKSFMFIGFFLSRLLNLWFACGSPFTKMTEITKTKGTTKITQTAENKEWWINGNRGNQGNDENHENPGCKPHPEGPPIEKMQPW